MPHDADAGTTVLMLVFSAVIGLLWRNFRHGQAVGIAPIDPARHEVPGSALDSAVALRTVVCCRSGFGGGPQQASARQPTKA